MKAEVTQLVRMAEQADQQAIPDGMNIPQELAIREQRLVVIDQACEVIEAQAQERYEREKAEYDTKMERRAEHDQSPGQKSRGKPPKAPVPGPSARDQVNLTDAPSRIIPVSGGGFEQAYNAQGAVDADTMLGLAVTVTQAPHDKQQMEPMLVLLQQHEVPVQTVVADAGDFSEKNVEACAAAGIQPLIAIRRPTIWKCWNATWNQPSRWQKTLRRLSA